MKKAMRCVVFLLITALLFLSIDRLFVRKSLYGWWNMTTKINGFFNSEENAYDVIFCGSSHSYCSFNPLVIGEETGLSCYTVATPKQPLWATYYYIDEAIKRQNPSLIVLDIFTFSIQDEHYDESTNYTFTDDFPTGLNKLKMIYHAVPKGERFNLLFRFGKYHSRWSELEYEDYNYNPRSLLDYLGGYCMLTSTDSSVTKPDTTGVTPTPASSKNELWLKNIISLCKEHNVKLLLVKTPSNETSEQRGYFLRAEQIAEETGTEFINFNERYSEIGIALTTDFYDKAHFNHIGAEKFGRYFSKNFLSDLKPKNTLGKDFYTRLARYKREFDGNYNVLKLSPVVLSNKFKGDL